MNKGLKLIISIAIPLAAGFAGSYFTRPEIQGWFQTITKPDWQPPNWLFGPVWTILYIMMGIALFLVWNKPVPAAKKNIAIILWIIQLILNFLWSFLFFNQHELGMALIEIIILWFFILFTIIAFSKISKTAAWLLVPYIAWVSFATMLTYSIYSLNT